MKQRFDLSLLAENGLRKGFTTGSCATACVKAAAYLLCAQQKKSTVQISLPDSNYFLPISIHEIKSIDENQSYASVIKDGGDDPDITNGATIFVYLTKIEGHTIEYVAGKGVGTITELGFAFPIGSPAINEVPRQMMETALAEVLEECSLANSGFRIQVGCVHGEEMARKTYNPRVGIVGGISILGTTGIVEPKSLSSWLASVQLYIRIALADRPSEIVFSPGNIGKRFAEKTLQFPQKNIVQMANFIGFSLEYLNEYLEQHHQRLPCLWVMGHPGKLAKILADAWDTHSQASQSALPLLCKYAKDFGFSADVIQQCETLKIVEAFARVLSSSSLAPQFWHWIESQIAAKIQQKTNYTDQVTVRLFQMDGTWLGKI